MSNKEDRKLYRNSECDFCGCFMCDLQIYKTKTMGLIISCKECLDKKIEEYKQNLKK